MNSPIVIISPGLTGGSNSNYITHLMKYGEKLGYRMVTINNRGTSNTQLTTSSINLIDSSNDLKEAIEYI